MRRRVPFEGQRIQFGTAEGTAHNYYTEMLKTFHEYVVPRLLRPFSADEINDITPQDFKDGLPGAQFIADLTSFKCKSKENVLLSRILYSAYHHQPESGAVFRKTAVGETSVCAFGIEPNSSLQSLRPMVFSCIAPNSLAACRPKF